MTESRAPYSNAHRNIQYARGKASEYDCIRCGRPAQEWAYQHCAEEPLICDGSVYSLDVDDYSPMCVSCHITYDKEADPRMEERTRNRSIACGDGAKKAAKERPEEYRARGIYMSRLKRLCRGCDRISSPGGLAMHQKHSGHSGWSEI